MRSNLLLNTLRFIRRLAQQDDARSFKAGVLEPHSFAHGERQDEIDMSDGLQ